jgi:hypothetical protein
MSAPKVVPSNKSCEWNQDGGHGGAVLTFYCKVHEEGPLFSKNCPQTEIQDGFEGQCLSRMEKRRCTLVAGHDTYTPYHRRYKGTKLVGTWSS